MDKNQQGSPEPWICAYGYSYEGETELYFMLLTEGPKSECKKLYDSLNGVTMSDNGKKLQWSQLLLMPKEEFEANTTQMAGSGDRIH